MIPDTEPPDPADEDLADYAAEEAAALDDYVGGFSEQIESAASSSANPDDVASTLDLIFRLRQTAAAEGGEVRLPKPEVPASIGRFQVIAVAGEGGFAIVWEAFDPLLRRRVAVKVRQPDALLSPGLRRRFLREAEIASRLVHPHIVTIHELGEESGREYIVEELCVGGSLAAWLARHPGPMPAGDAARLVKVLAEAVAYAHEQGVIHRDIKPANVLLVPARAGDDAILPDGLTVKLGDFGLCAIREDVAENTQLTLSGVRLGTPAWMAPEQIDRTFGAVGPATDVHGLGLILERLLTGMSPFDGRTDVEIYKGILLDERTSLERAVRGLHADLAAVCALCLAKQPAERYPAAADLAADLGRYLAGTPTAARPLSSAARVVRGIARRRGAAALAVGLLAVVLGVVLGTRDRRVADGGRGVDRDAPQMQAAAVELQRSFAAWRAGNVSRAEALVAATRELDPPLAASLAGRWLQRRLHGERTMLFAPIGTGTTAAVHAVAVSPDGAWVAAGAADGTLLLIDRHRGVCDSSPVAHDEINDVCIAADGRTVATVGQDGVCRWWAIAEGPRLVESGRCKAHDGPLYGSTFLGDGGSLVIGGADRRLRCIDRTDGRVRRTIELPVPSSESSEVEAVASITDAAVAVACGDHVFVVDACDASPPIELEHRRKDSQPPVFHSIAVSPDRQFVAAGGSERRVRVWSLADRRLRHLLPTQPSWVQGCSFSNDGRRVATACRDGTIRVFEVGTAEVCSRLVGHAGRVWDVAYGPAGEIVSAGADGTVREWTADQDPERVGIDDVSVDGVAIGSMKVLPGGEAGERRLIAAGLDTQPFMLARERSSTEWRSWQIDAGFQRKASVNDIAVHHDGRSCLMSLVRGQTYLVPLSRDVVVTPHELPGAGTVHGFGVWLPDGRLATIGSEEGLRLWSADLTRSTSLASFDWAVYSVAGSPCAPWRVAIAGTQVEVVTLPDGSALGAGVEPKAVSLRFSLADAVNAIDWSPDGRLLLCGTRAGEVVVCDAGSGQRMGQLVPHSWPILAVAFSLDGRIVVSADKMGVRLSDARSLVTFDEIRPGWELECVSVSPDCDFIAIGGRDHTNRVGSTARLAVLELPAAVGSVNRTAPSSGGSEAVLPRPAPTAPR